MDLPNTAHTTQNGASGTHVTAAPATTAGASPWSTEPATHADSPLHATTPLGPAPAPRALTVSLVIPAKNEARNLAWVLGEIPDCVDEVVMVDGRSEDATLLMASIHRPDIRFVAQSGTGKGDALRAGFASATGDIVVMIDADGSMSAREIPHFLHFLTHGYDFVKGSRFIAGGGSLDITAFRRTGNWALLQLVNTLYDANLTDLCYGFCAFHRQFLDLLDLTADGFDIEAQMTVHALKAGLRIAEVPSLELPRRSGRSNLHAIRDGNLVLRSVLRDRQRRHRARHALDLLHLPYSGRRQLATHHG
ncbi:glycosyl transferase family 2 [Oryzihumus leptocrescens]|uniref:Glycosyl transferase family 2 n=1 Tax=Oryzihumus leptocrescens TaxID=297536 RepID=A0A542ZGD9_9MICO|nr:glycosyl transferase family 2 [Oryzihumus leptocrescens]